MLETENVVDQLKHIIADELDVNIKFDEIDETAPLLEEGLGLDSVAVMEFISLMEARFGFKFSEEELSLEPFNNLQTLADCISTKITTS